jgi:hypothetical protein
MTDSTKNLGSSMQTHAFQVTLNLALLFGIASAFAACSTDDESSSSSRVARDEPGTASGSPKGAEAGAAPQAGGPGPVDTRADEDPNIVERNIDYGEALRTATLKLVGDLPSIDDLRAISASNDLAAQKPVYEAQIDKLLADPRFATRMIQWWRDTFRTGNTDKTLGSPDFDSAAVFAAQVVIDDRPYADLFTAKTGNCPTFANGAFAAADCNNGAPQAGVLSNPGLMAQFFANMAFRRVRFVQETFVCTKFPAEYSKAPTPLGAKLYTSPWDFNSITGGMGSRVDFKDTSSIICANCHTSMNHIAPLFANFDTKGAYNAAAIQVETPVVSNDAQEKISRLTDWLPAGQTTAWRNGTPVASLPELGTAMARDADVARCAVNRVWNWAMSRGDVVNDLAIIPAVVTEALYADFTANGMKMKRLIRNTFTADDFVKF